MTSPFDANLPRRKPKTRLGAMLAEVSAPCAVPDDSSPPLASCAMPSAISSDISSDFSSDVSSDISSDVPVLRDLPARPKVVVEEPAPRDARKQPEDPVLRGRARIAMLKAKLEEAEQKRTLRPPEPTETAERVRETVAILRERLGRATRERDEQRQLLEGLRAEIDGVRSLLEAEKGERAKVEVLAEERKRAAEALVEEAEALADERDRAIARVAEYKELEGEQSAIIEKMEVALVERDSALDVATREIADLRAELDASAVDLESVQSRLDESTEANQRLRRDVARLEDEIARIGSARAALAEIHELVDQVAI